MLTSPSAVDTALEQTIRGQLGREVGVALRDLGVVSIEGKIRLCGEVSSYAHKKRAAELAGTIHGVRRVINQLRVTPS